MAIALVLGLMMVIPLIPSGTAEYRNRYYDVNPEPGVGDANAETWDYDDTKKWLDANAEPVDKIFFDLLATQFGIPHVPSVNGPDSSTRQYFTTTYQAYLGFWRDCNGDGYIGSAATGAVHYPVAQGHVEADENDVDADVICPSTSPYQDALQFNEFISIGDNTRDVSNSDQSKTVLCPDRNGGPSGAAEKTPRANDDAGILDGNNGANIVCHGEQRDYVQDDYAKVWMDLHLPIEPPKQTGVFTPSDGEFRDTNGHFHFVDGTLLGAISNAVGGPWPVVGQDEKKEGDDNRFSGRQCDPDAAAGHYDGDTATAPADNLQAWAGQSDPLGPNACSPIPNVRSFGLPVLGTVAWPGHLVEDRNNNSERPGDPGTPITKPFNDDRSSATQDCSLKDDPDTWDEDPSDGDPLYGGSPTDDGYFAQYYGTNDDGPSLDPTISNILMGVDDATANQVIGEPCTYGGTTGAIEGHGAVGQTAFKTQVSTTAGWIPDLSFNPSTAPGGPAPDTMVCLYDNAVLFDHPTRCGGHWFGANFIDVPDEPPDVYWLRTFRTTAYADVSYGLHVDPSTGGFDVAGDGPFDKADDGVWDPVPGLTIDPAVNLPAGTNDAHQYGDEQCGTVDSLGSGDYAATGTPGTDLPVGTNGNAYPQSWSCDRNVWAVNAGLADPDTGAVDCAGFRDGVATTELGCWMIPFVGDPFDLWDIDCDDSDQLGMSTTDENGPVGDAGDFPLDNQDCDTIGVDGPG